MLANTSRLALRYIPETTFGVIPGSGNVRALRMTGEGLNYAIKKDWSKEIRSDRSVADLVSVDADPSGSIPFELSYGEYDDMLQAACMGSWSEINAASITVTITTSNVFTALAGLPFANMAVGMKFRFAGFANAVNNQTYTVSATNGTTTLTVAGTPLVNEASVAVSFSSGGQAKGTATFTTTTVTFAAGTPFGNVVAGQWICTAGAVNSQNNGWKQVVSATSGVITCAASTFLAEVSTAGVSVIGSRLVNGTTQRSFALEEFYSDIVQYVAYRGMNVSKFSLDFKLGAILGGSLDFMGKDQLPVGGTTNLPATIIASLINDVMNSASGVANVMEGGVALANTYMKAFSLSLDNTLRGQKGIGVLGNIGVGVGHLSITGKTDFYFADQVLINKFINNNSSSLSVRVADSAGNGYVLTMPKVRYSSGDASGPGIDQDGMVSLGFQAVYDPTSTNMIQIDRGGAIQPL